MVQFVVDVVVDTSKTEKGAKKVKKGLKETETAAGRLEKQLKKAFAVAAITGAAIAIGRLADAYTNAQNKLRNIVKGEEELIDVTEKLFDVANRTRQSFESTATVYSRIGVAAKDLGLEQEQLLQFTESLNQAVALSGASATEAEAGLIQLSQGLAAGALRGEELNSVLEQLPAVADVIAKRLDVTRGQLRKMGAEGKISADIVIDAFAEAREELEERFGKTVPTIGQAFTVLKNNALESVGAIDEVTGASGAFAATIIFASENLDVLAAGILVVALSALPAMITAVKALIVQSAIFSKVAASGALFNPIILGAAAAGAATILLIDAFIDVEQAARETKAELDKLLLSDEDLLLVTISNVEKTLEKVQKAAAEGLFPDDEAAERIEGLQEVLAGLRGETEALNDGSGRTLKQIRAETTARTNLATVIADTTKATVEEAQASLQTNRALEKRATLLKQVANIEEEQRRPLSEEQKEALELAFDQAQALREQQEALDAIKAPQEELRARIAALNVLEEKQLITTDELKAALAGLAGAADGVDLSGLGGGDAAADALADIRAQIEAAKEKGRVDNERKLLLTEIQGPLAGLIEKEQLLKDLEAESLISKGQLNEALAANRREIELLNPEVARLADLQRELVGPTEELEQRQADLNTLILQGGANTALYVEELRKVNEQLNPLNEEEQRRKDILEAIEGPEQERIARLTELNALLAAGTINATQYREELERMGVATETSNTASAGFAVGLKNMRAEMTDVQGAAQALVENGIRGAEDALVSFITTGEADFSAFVDSLIADITRLLIKQALLAAIGGGPAAGGGGFLGSLFGAADGGDFPGGAVGVVGEEGPELIRTPPGGASITPAGETAAIMGAKQPAPQVNVGGPTINNMIVDDPEAVPAGIESPEGTTAVLNVIRKERRTVRGTIG